ncbi:SDR family NAD(P)-dependent oxidoreductase [Halobacteriaceae archaeon GCM10025711]
MDAELYDSLAGQTALVTGATRGIGRQIAVDLAAHGATVYAGARNVDDVDDGDLRPVRLDVTDETQIAAATTTIADEHGGLDVLVNNAAVHGPGGRYGDLDGQEVEATLRTNLHGPMQVTKHALPLLRARDNARVVNVSSSSGQFSSEISTSHLPYGISKAGLNAFTTALAAQYEDLLVNAVCPGWVRTDMGGSSAPRSVEKGAETPVWLARFRDGPSGHFWRDEEIQEW